MSPDRFVGCLQNSWRPHVHRALRPSDGELASLRALQGEAETQRHLLKDLLHEAFGGSRRALVLQALEAEPASAEELEEIRKLLNDAKEGAR